MKPIPIGLMLLLFLAGLLRSPHLGDELKYKMDAANACNTLFVYESWQDQPTSRLFCPKDYRFQLEELGTGEGVHYRHFPPLAHVPLGIATWIFGPQEIVLRSFSILMSLVLLAMSFRLIHKLIDRKVALWTVFLMAVCGHAIHYSRVADPVITNSYLLVWMAFTYLVWLEKPSRRTFLGFQIISFFAFLTDWNAYAVYLVLCLHALVFMSKSLSKGKFSLWTTFNVVGALSAIVLYHTLASGGVGYLIEDFKQSVGTRISRDTFQVLQLEAIRLAKHYNTTTLLLPLFFLIFLGKKSSEGENLKAFKFLVLLAIGGFLFPLFTRNLTFHHEYWSYWTLAPIMACAALSFQALMNQPQLILKSIAFVALVLFIVQSSIIGYNRLYKHKTDYLLARHQGKAFDQGEMSGVLVTEANDLLQILDYYSNAYRTIISPTLEDFKKAEAMWRKSSYQGDLIFMSSTANEIWSSIPEFEEKGYPFSKLTGEFNLPDSENTPYWNYLKKSCQEIKTLEPYRFFIFKKE